MKRLSVVIFIGLMLMATTAAWSKETKKMVDVDGDGYLEAEVYYSNSEIVKALVDYDHDGRRETVIYYKNGHRDHSEESYKGNGITNRWIYYYFTGTPWKVAEDLNGDGKPDYWVYLKDGQIYKWEQDRNGDGKPDVSTVYEIDKTNNARVLMKQSYDNNFDGVFETVSGKTAEKKEAELPHSLAEALLR